MTPHNAHMKLFMVAGQWTWRHRRKIKTGAVVLATAVGTAIKAMKDHRKK